MSILGIIGWLIVVIIIAVIVIYAIGLCRRAWDSIKSGADTDTKELLSVWDNLYEGSIGLFKKND